MSIIINMFAGEEPFAACEASLADAESQVVLNCNFSVDVESFTVKKNTSE